MMDPVQQRAIDALEPYIQLSKSASSPRIAADLVTQATSNPNTYVFAELLEMPNIQALRQSQEYSPYLVLLEIFSYGKWEHYDSNPSLPRLSDAQAHKLRLLTLLSLSGSHATLTYDSLLKSLSLPGIAILEQLVISAVYASLISARLNPESRLVDVNHVAPLRDLPPSHAPHLTNIISTWEDNCGSVLGELEASIQSIKDNARRRKEREAGWSGALDEAVKKAIERDSFGRGPAGNKRMSDDFGEFDGRGAGGGKMSRGGMLGTMGIRGRGRSGRLG